MNHFDKIALALPAAGLDGVLLTGEYNRFYASGFATTGTDGVALVTTEGNFYFTDSRYIEAAEKNLKGFTVRMTHPGSSEIERINEVIGEHTIKKLGFEEHAMTYGDYLRYNEALHAVLVPMQAKIDAFRATKEPWEIELMRKAQAITDQTFSRRA